MQYDPEQAVRRYGHARRLQHLHRQLPGEDARAPQHGLHEQHQTRPD